MDDKDVDRSEAKVQLIWLDNVNLPDIIYRSESNLQADSQQPAEDDWQQPVEEMIEPATESTTDLWPDETDMGTPPVALREGQWRLRQGWVAAGLVASFVLGAAAGQIVIPLLSHRLFTSPARTAPMATDTPPEARRVTWPMAVF